MKNLNSLSELGVDLNILSQYQILCLPENITNRLEDSDLVDSGESINLSKLLKEEGAKCANSYDLGLNTKIAELRGLDLWLGSIWILEHAVLPLFISVVGRLLGEKILGDFKQRKEVKVRATFITIIDGEISAEITYSGDAATFLKVLNGINDG